MNSNLFICFIGVDGSGKTTMARYAEKELQKMGVSVKYVHSLIEARLLKPFLKLGRRSLSSISESSNYKKFRKQKKHVFSKYPFIIPIYKAILIADYTPQLLWNIWWPILRRQTVISDRYIYDTVIYMGLNLGYDVNMLASEIKKWFFFFPEPDATFLMDIDEKVAFQRKDDVPSIHYLRERKGLYLDLSSKLKITVLDGSKKVSSLYSIVENKLSKL